MIRRIVLIALSLAVLGGCATYDRGYRYAAPSEAGYGDYYYDPAPAPTYVAPSYFQYSAYSSLYWGLDRHYYSRWHRPGFHYGVTWFPNDWFAFSVVHRYPIGYGYGRGYRYGYGYYGHPFSPYRYSYYDHRYHGWNHHQRRHRHDRPRYGHPSNERYADRERVRQLAENRGVQRRPYDQRAERDVAPRETMRDQLRARGGNAGGPGATAFEPGASVGRARAAAMDAARVRNAADVSDRAGPMTNVGARPWQQGGARSDVVRSPSGDVPRRASGAADEMPRAGRPQDAGRMGNAREAAMVERQRAAPAADQAPRPIERTTPRAAPVRRQAERTAVPAAADRMPARAQVQQRQQPAVQQRRATRPQQASQGEMTGRAPMRQALPQRTPADAAPAARMPRQARQAAPSPQRAPARAVRQAPVAAPAPQAAPAPRATPRAAPVRQSAPSRRTPRSAVEQER